MRKRLAALALFAVASAALAVEPDEILEDAALEARARALSAGLRCLVCQNQSIDDSDAPLAKDLRLLIRERLSAGASDRQVVDFVVNRYGEFVLLKPKLRAGTILLWVGPFAILLVGGAIVLLKRRTTAEAEGSLTEEEKIALDRISGAP